MADVKFEVVRFALDSTKIATETQDVTITGFGTPSAAIFILSACEIDDTIDGNTYLGIGFTDGTNQNCTVMRSTDAQATSSTRRSSTTSRCIFYVDGSIEYSFNSWITNGVRITCDTPASTDFLCTCILIGGTDVSNAFVGAHDDLGTTATSTDITAPGFEPDLVLMTCIGANTLANNATNALLSFGIGINDGVDTQSQISFSSVHGEASATTTAFVSNDSIVSQVFNGAESWTASIGTYDASGFTLTTDAGAGADCIFYLALKFSNSPDIDLFDLTIPTSGNYAETTPNFTPSFGMIVGLQGPTTRNTVATSSQYSAFISAFDDNGIYTNSATDEDAAATTVSKNLSSDQFRILDYQGSANAALASSYAFDSQGWDFTLSTNPSAAILGFGLAIGSGGGGGGPTAIPPRSHNLDNQFATIIAHRLNGHIQ